MTFFFSCFLIWLSFSLYTVSPCLYCSAGLGHFPLHSRYYVFFLSGPCSLACGANCPGGNNFSFRPKRSFTPPAPPLGPNWSTSCFACRFNFSCPPRSPMNHHYNSSQLEPSRSPGRGFVVSLLCSSGLFGSKCPFLPQIELYQLLFKPFTTLSFVWWPTFATAESCRLIILLSFLIRYDIVFPKSLYCLIELMTFPLLLIK